MTLLCILLALPTREGQAQSIPGSADAGRLSKHPLPVLLLPQLSSVRRDTPSASSDAISIAGAEQVYFVFNGLTLAGMKAYPQGHFYPLYSSLIGKKVSLQDVISIINGIHQTYKKDGYILSSFVLPEQDITSGFVTVDVIEGRILNVTPNKTSSRDAALIPYFDKMTGIYPFNIHEFEHWMLVLNTLSGSRFKSVLRQPQDRHIQGGIDVVIVEEDLPPDMSLTVNNFGSAYAGPWQAFSNMSFDNLFIPYDRIGLLLSTTYPTKEVKFGEIEYSTPIHSLPGTAFKTSINWGGTHSGSSLKELDLGGLSREINFDITYDHLLSRRTNWVSEIGFRAKDVRSKISGDELYDDRLRVASVATTWQHVDNFRGVSLINAEVSHGFNILGARESRSFNLSRADGRSDFTKVTFQASRLQTLPFKFQGLIQTAGQYSFTPVLSAEEFGFGGVPSGRGLDPSELTGDHGISMAVELRYVGVPEYHTFQLTPYAFIDLGKVWQKGDNPDNPETAITAGIGNRIVYQNSTTIDMMIALPLTHRAENPPKYGNGESLRYLISLRRNF